MICPKCGLEQPDAVECKKCGVIVAKYRPREPRPSAPDSGPAPGGTGDQAPPAPDLTPGWARGSTPPPPATEGGYSRFGPGADREALRRVEAQAATKRFVFILILAGLVGAIFTFSGSLFRIYGNRAKLELDVTSDASDLVNVRPDGVRDQIRHQAEGYGFTIKDDRIRISFSEVDGKPLAKMLLSSAGVSFVTLKVLIEFTAETRSIGIPLSFDIKGSSTISTRVMMYELKRWAEDEYGEGLVGNEPAPESEPEPAPEPEPEAQDYQEPAYPDNPGEE